MGGGTLTQQPVGQPLQASFGARREARLGGLGCWFDNGKRKFRGKQGQINSKIAFFCGIGSFFVSK